MTFMCKKMAERLGCESKSCPTSGEHRESRNVSLKNMVHMLNYNIADDLDGRGLEPGQIVRCRRRHNYHCREKVTQARLEGLRSSSTTVGKVNA
jgi:hypothetical protein